MRSRRLCSDHARSDAAQPARGASVARRQERERARRPGQGALRALHIRLGGRRQLAHLSGELFRLVAGIDLTHVPFKGSGPGATALVAGQVTMMFAGPLLFESQIKAGRLRALAVADRKRTEVFPDVPTMAEAGFAGVETGTWYGFLAPARRRVM